MKENCLKLKILRLLKITIKISFNYVCIALKQLKYIRTFEKKNDSNLKMKDL